MKLPFGQDQIFLRLSCSLPADVGHESTGLRKKLAKEHTGMLGLDILELDASRLRERILQELALSMKGGPVRQKRQDI